MRRGYCGSISSLLLQETYSLCLAPHIHLPFYALPTTDRHRVLPLFSLCCVNVNRINNLHPLRTPWTHRSSVWVFNPHTIHRQLAQDPLPLPPQRTRLWDRDLLALFDIDIDHTSMKRRCVSSSFTSLWEINIDFW